MYDTKTIKELCTYTIESQTKKQKSRAKNSSCPVGDGHWEGSSEPHHRSLPKKTD